jgi:hypothetical protein
MELKLSKRSEFGEPTLTSGVDARQLLYFLLLIPALMASQMPLGIYPPLDTRLPMGLIIGAFLLSAVLQLQRLVRRQPNNVGWQRMLSTCSALALPLIGLLLFLNGRLDRSPPNDVSATVIRKIAPIGYRQAQYGLVVSSWRPGRSSEVLNVGSRVFEHATTGKSVTVELRKGYLGLPWYDDIAPE